MQLRTITRVCGEACRLLALFGAYDRQLGPDVSQITPGGLVGEAQAEWMRRLGLGGRRTPGPWGVCHYRSCLLLPVALETCLGDFARSEKHSCFTFQGSC